MRDNICLRTQICEVYIMKKFIATLLCLILSLALFGCESINHPYTKEYVPGQGNIKGDVDIEYFYKHDKRFEIGASSEGYAVFKDPDAAFDALLAKYSDGLKLIQKENNLPYISKNNYDQYKICGMDITTGSKKEREQVNFIEEFLDIYENSFK